MPFTKSLGFNQPPKELKRQKKQVTAGGFVRFPDDLGAHQLVMQFFAYEGFVASEDRQDRGTPTIQIALPIPSNLQESYSITYNSASMGPLVGALTRNASSISEAAGNLALDVQSAAENPGSAFQNLVGSLKSAAGTAVRSGGQLAANPVDGLRNAASAAADSTTADILSLAARRSAQAVAPAVAGGIDILTGTTINPHNAVLLDSIPLRTHSFSWKFAPRNSKDWDRLDFILGAIKRRIHPGLGGTGGESLLTYPNEVDLSIVGSLADYYPFKRSVVTSFSINYAPEGTPAFHAGDGKPVVLTLDMGFQETEIITSGDFGAGVPGSSAGSEGDFS